MKYGCLPCGCCCRSHCHCFNGRPRRTEPPEELEAVPNTLPDFLAEAVLYLVIAAVSTVVMLYFLMAVIPQK